MPQTRQRAGLSGRQFKLVSESGTLLGTITIPERMASFLDEGRHNVQWHFIETQAPNLGYGALAYGSFETRKVTLSLNPLFRDGVTLYGVTIEEIEQQPGFSFMPSAAYLRSIVE